MRCLANDDDDEEWMIIMMGCLTRMENSRFVGCYMIAGTFLAVSLTRQLLRS